MGKLCFKSEKKLLRLDKKWGEEFKAFLHRFYTPPPEPFFSHPGKRIILKEKGKLDSYDSWFEQRIEALKKFIASTANLLDVGDNHRLSADDESYIPRLKKDLEGI